MILTDKQRASLSNSISYYADFLKTKLADANDDSRKFINKKILNKKQPKKGNSLVGTLVGFALGFAAAILFAKESGKDTRDKLTSKIKETTGGAKDYTEKEIDKLEKKASNVNVNSNI